MPPAKTKEKNRFVTQKSPLTNCLEIRCIKAYHTNKEKEKPAPKNNTVDTTENPAKSLISAENPPADALGLGVQAAMSHQYEQDSRTFLQSLAFLLESSLPGEATITRSGWFGGDKRAVRKVEVTFSPDGGATAMRYTLTNAHLHRPSASRVHIVRGVTLKNEPIAISDWISAVATAIAHRAAQSRQTRDALRDLLD